MLVRDDGPSWTAIGQPAHAWLAGQVARAWARPALSDEAVLATIQHDVAWSAWDLAPPLFAEAGRACAFWEASRSPSASGGPHASCRRWAGSP